MKETDPTLPHQIVIRVRKAKVYVSCNCRTTMNSQHPLGGHRMGHDPIGFVDNISEAFDLYNRSSNHNLPFNKEDQIGPYPRRPLEDRMFKCPYRNCPFDADTEDEVDDHILYVVTTMPEDPDHQESERRT